MPVVHDLPPGTKLTLPDDGPALEDVLHAARHLGLTLERYVSLCVADQTVKLLQALAEAPKDGPTPETGQGASQLEPVHGDHTY